MSDIFLPRTLAGFFIAKKCFSGSVFIGGFEMETEEAHEIVVGKNRLHTVFLPEPPRSGFEFNFMSCSAEGGPGRFRIVQVEYAFVDGLSWWKIERVGGQHRGKNQFLLSR